MNPMQMIMQMMRTGGDPRQMVIQMLSQNPNLDSVGKNLLDRAQANDLQGATSITQNVAREKGVDTNAVLGQFRNGKFNG